MFDEAPDAVSADPECLGREEGYTFSHGPCRSSFHLCYRVLLLYFFLVT